MALADSVFVNDIKDLGQLYAIKVSEEPDRIRLTWQDEWLSRSIFAGDQSRKFVASYSRTRIIEMMPW